MGSALVLVGVLVILLAGAVALLGAPVLALSVGVVVAMLAVFSTGLLLTRRAVVVRLGDAGYRVRYVRGAGVRQALWKDVEDAVATTMSGQRCLQLRLRDGRTTTVPVDVLAGDPDEFARDLQDHLEKGQGYRALG
jgi:hypothetical protein